MQRPLRLTQGQSQGSAITARAQLTLVEHALCPLDAGASLTPNFSFTTTHFFTDPHRNRRKATVRIGAIDGLSAHDELYLWGLLAIALTQRDQRPEFMASPYFCLRRLGLIDADRKGGREFELFRAAIKRLAGIRYQNDRFYDPIRGEHREVAFGFLSYSLPLGNDSQRAWRFAWDPIFFELAKATGGALAFDLSLYRDFDPATRRLYLLLKKLFWRNEVTPKLELRHLAVHVLGFSETLATRHLKQKLTRCLSQLVDRDLIELPIGTKTVAELFVRDEVGLQTLILQRGPKFHEATVGVATSLKDSPLYDPLKAIGFDDRTVARLLDVYSPSLIEQWADITLAAKERRGERFFSASPQAYFVDNIQAASAGNRTPPDWWRELRKREREIDEKQRASTHSMVRATNEKDAFERYLQDEVRDAFDETMNQLAADLRRCGQGDADARRQAESMTRTHFMNRFRRSQSSSSSQAPSALRDFLLKFPTGS